MSKKEIKDRESEKIETIKLQIQIGTRIRQLREKKGLTQTELAIRMNERDRQVVQRLEQGKTNCSINLLRITAEALRVNIQDFFLMK